MRWLLMALCAQLGGCLTYQWDPGDFPIEVRAEEGLRPCWQRLLDEDVERINTDAQAAGAVGPVFVLEWVEEAPRRAGSIAVRERPLADVGRADLVVRPSGIESVVVRLNDQGCQYNTVVHELGHSLGLMHTEEKGRVMHAPAGSEWADGDVAYIVAQMTR